MNSISVVHAGGGYLVLCGGQPLELGDAIGKISARREEVDFVHAINELAYHTRHPDISPPVKVTIELTVPGPLPGASSTRIAPPLRREPPAAPRFSGLGEELTSDNLKRMQRAMYCEAFGKLRAVLEMFRPGSMTGGSDEDWEVWSNQILEFDDWVMDESPISYGPDERPQGLPKIAETY